MNDFIAIANIDAVFAAKRLLPTITLWNRLEGRPRRADFDEALQAKVADALWMLARQWQMGEFQGDDAGSPITAKVHIDTTELTKFKPANGAAELFPNTIPFETRVEARPITYRAGDQALSWDIRAELGRHWLRLVGGIEAGLAQKFIDALGLAEPDPDDPAQAAVTAHRESWETMAALAGRAMDGYALVEHLNADPANHAHDLVALDDPAANAAAVEAAEVVFLDLFRRLFYQPEGPDAWLPERMEYAFETSGPQDGGEAHFVAEEYFHGHLDWYNLDRVRAADGLGPVEGEPEPDAVTAFHTASFVPVPIKFDGMPNTRWWTFEDGPTNFGDIDADTTEISKLLVMEFALVYANDWFLLPFTVPAGTVARVRGLTVTNVFGERTWVRPAGDREAESWQRWAMFRNAITGDKGIPGKRDLLILPSVPKIQEGAPREAIELIRDEVANMVFGIETRVPLPHGGTRAGRQAGRETRGYFARRVEALGPPALDPTLLENEAAIRYEVMTQVPENWIPFIPVHVPGSNREIQLRRAALPRVIEGDPDPPVKVRPRTALLRQGLDAEVPAGYDLHEEEVPRAGVRVSQSFQRTRWYGGAVFTWLGARKATGRGERKSRLRFDQIFPKRS